MLAALALNIMSGVAVAGIDAGKVFNSWPLMNGAWIPGGYWKTDLGWRNAFENMGCVQFNHRQFAYATYGLATWVFWTFRGLVLPGATLRVLVYMYLAMNVQVGIGIWAVLEQVPVPACVSHQTNALITLSCALALLNSVKRPNAKFLSKLQRVYTAQKVNKLGNL